MGVAYASSTVSDISHPVTGFLAAYILEKASKRKENGVPNSIGGSIQIFYDERHKQSLLHESGIQKHWNHCRLLRLDVWFCTQFWETSHKCTWHQSWKLKPHAPTLQAHQTVRGRELPLRQLEAVQKGYVENAQSLVILIPFVA